MPHSFAPLMMSNAETESNLKNDKHTSVKGVILRSRVNIFHPQSEWLIKKHNFIELNNGPASKGIKTPIENILFFLDECWFLLKNLRKFKKTDILIASGTLAIPLKILILLGLVRYKKFIWFGFFVHSDKAFSFFKIVLKLLKVKNELMVLNSKADVDIYAERLKLDKANLTYMPVGNWKPVTFGIEDKQLKEGDYYFAGGYTNRDYKGLIEVFHGRKEKLIIVGSKLNKDLQDISNVSPNIQILKDIDKVEFELLLANAKVCILPIKDKDAGASGHMVLLAYMRRKKPIISPDFEAMKEYLVENQSGIFYSDLKKDLPKLLTQIENSEYDLKSLGSNAYSTYELQFTYEALVQRLDEIVEAAISSCSEYPLLSNVTVP